MVKYSIGNISKDKSEISVIEEISSLKLSEIDEFTSSFENEADLKLYLYKRYSELSLNYVNPLYIVYEYAKKKKKHPIVYKNAYVYLNKETIIGRIENLKEDVKFLKKIVSFYGSYKNLSSEVFDLKLYISSYNRNNIGEKEGILLTNAINSFYFKLRNFDYREVRKLGLLIYNYDQEESKLKDLDFVYSGSFINDIPLNNEKVIGNNDYDDDSEEPIFPPNSAELEEYKRYLEELEIRAEQRDKEEAMYHNGHYR